MPTPLAPLAFFAFRRPDHTRRALEALAASPLLAGTEVHFFSDGPRRPDDEAPVAGVRRVLDAFRGAATVVRHDAPANRGLARSVIEGVSSILASHDRVVVLEDDLVTSPDFLAFTNEALARYAGDPRVFSLAGYQLPITLPADYAFDAYFGFRSGSWGWATWRDRWTRIDWEVRDYPAFARRPLDQRRFNRGGDDLSRMLRLQVEGRIDSWAIRFAYAQFRAGGLTLYPTQSRVQNLGADGSGTHVASTGRLDVTLAPKPPPWRWPEAVAVDARIARVFKEFCRIPRRELVREYLRCVPRWFRRGVV